MNNQNYVSINSFSQNQKPTNVGNNSSDSTSNNQNSVVNNDFSSTSQSTSQNLNQQSSQSISDIKSADESFLDINSVDPLSDEMQLENDQQAAPQTEDNIDKLIDFYSAKLKEMQQGKDPVFTSETNAQSNNEDFPKETNSRSFDQKNISQESQVTDWEQNYVAKDTFQNDSIPFADFAGSNNDAQPIDRLDEPIIGKDIYFEPSQQNINITPANSSTPINYGSAPVLNADNVDNLAKTVGFRNSDDLENQKLLEEFSRYEKQVLEEMNKKMGIKEPTDLSKYADMGYRGDPKVDLSKDIEQSTQPDLPTPTITQNDGNQQSNAIQQDTATQQIPSISADTIVDPSIIYGNKTVIDATDYNQYDFSTGSGSMMHDDSSLSNYVNVDDIIRDIKSIKIQGATNVAIATFMGLKIFVNQYKREVPLEVFISDVQRAGVSLANARPNEPLAKNGVKFIINKLNRETGLINGIDPLPQDANEIFNKASSIINNTDDFSNSSLYQSSSDEIYHVSDLAAAKKRVLELCEDYITHIKNAKVKIIEYAGPVMKNFKSILTHCHSSTSEKIIIEQSKRVSGFKVACTETRPLFQGRITAKNLAEAGLDVTFVTDSAAPGFIAGKGSFPIDAVFIGADQMTINGDAINKVGSWSIASAAIAAGKPVYVVSSILKLDLTTAYKPVEIEMRSGKEIWDEAPKGVTVYNPSFEMIESRFITGYMTEIGVISPSELTRSAQQTYYWLA